MLRRCAVATAAATVGLAIAAASALGWHVDVTCTQAHVVGTPSTLVFQQGGHPYGLPVEVKTGWDVTVPVPAPPGYGPITVVQTWTLNGRPDSFTRTTPYPCGTPPPPPPPPAPPIPPPPAPPVPPPPHVTPPPPKAPCVPYPRSRYRLTERPSMRTVDHGPVLFRVRGPHIHWVHFHIDQRYTHKDHAAPFVMPTLLWRADQWGPMPRPLYGPHKVTAVVRTKCRTLHLVKLVFNKDPLPA